MRPDPARPSGGEQARKLDPTLIGQILYLTIPLAATNQLENLVGFIELYLVGKIGAEAISAVGIAVQITMIVGILMASVTTGTMAIVAQAVGGNRPKEVSHAVKQSFTWVTVVLLPISLLGAALAPQILRALSLQPEVIAVASLFLKISFAGLVLRSLNFVVANSLQAAGDTQTPLVLSFVSTLLRVPATYALVFGRWGLPRLGVAGAAVGALVGFTFRLVLGMLVLYSRRFAIDLAGESSFRPDFAMARRLFRIGIPSAIQGILRNGSNIVFVKLVALTANSTSAVAAFSIGSQMERVLRRTSLAFGTVSTALVGHSLGSEQKSAADARGWTTLLVGCSSILILGAVIAMFPRPFFEIFTTSKDVIQIGIPYFHAIAIAEPFMCAAIVTAGGLRAAGYTTPALYYTLLSQWFVRLPIAYILAFTMGYDFIGIWTSLVIFSVVQGVLTVRKYSKGEWKERFDS